jgi:hypothetical protein
MKVSTKYTELKKNIGNDSEIHSIEFEKYCFDTNPEHKITLLEV